MITPATVNRTTGVENGKDILRNIKGFDSPEYWFKG